MIICKYCGKEFKSKAGESQHRKHVHESSEEDKKKFAEKMSKIVTKTSIKKDLNCISCGKSFPFIANQDNWDKGNFPKHCSHSCANSRKMDKTKTINCVKCEKEIVVPKRSRTNLCEDCKPKKICSNCGKSIGRANKSGLCTVCIKEDPEYRKRLSDSVKGKAGGARPGAGRGKSGRYKNIPCDSTWELAYLIHSLDSGKSIKRCKETFSYTRTSGRNAVYHPDFLVDGEIVEIKGPQDKEWGNKLRSVSKPITVIGEKEIDFYIKYVFNEYKVNWKTLTALYD